jgi:hypothetical protein
MTGDERVYATDGVPRVSFSKSTFKSAHSPAARVRHPENLGHASRSCERVGHPPKLNSWIDPLTAYTSSRKYL